MAFWCGCAVVVAVAAAVSLPVGGVVVFVAQLPQLLHPHHRAALGRQLKQRHGAQTEDGQRHRFRHEPGL
jgi:hypothetical protein